MRKRLKKKSKILILSFFSLTFLSFNAHSAISVVDDTGSSVTSNAPVKRIISLAPHTTELLFAAGAGGRIVGAVQYSDYPAEAKAIPRVGDTHNLDIERIIALEPNLIVAWLSGNNPSNLKTLKEFNIPLYISEPHSLETIAKTIEDLGQLTGNRQVANEKSHQYKQTLHTLKMRYSNRTMVNVFYQIWHQPIFTINGDHIINEIMTICGGQNIFAQLPTLSTQISLESVLQADPEIIIASGMDKSRPSWLDTWQQWPSLSAVANRHIYFIPPDLIQRHTPRILKGTEMMCEFIDKVRQN